MMFTGIISEVGKIKSSQTVNNLRYYSISCHSIQSDLSIGDSIACNGICLSVTSFTHESITVEVMNQTYLTTTVPSWQTHTRIHLEKALKISDRLHGHIVQGHIDTTTHLTKRHTQNHTLYLHFYLHSRFSKYIVEHGSICIDGVSLTIANFTEGDFGVALIDMTIKSTTLGDLRIGGHVNIEFDIVGKYIQKMLIHSSEKSEISEEWLKKNGF